MARGATGTVSFYADSVLLGGAETLNGGAATFTTSALSTAGHAITAVYSGDENFLTSTSASLAQSQNQDASATSLALTGDNGSGGSVYGQALSLTATLSAVAPEVARRRAQSLSTAAPARIRSPLDRER